MKLAIMVGIPLSGKSSFCKQMMEQGWSVINPDTFRQVYSGTTNRLLDKPDERKVWDCVHLSAESLLAYGHDVLIDATNTNCWSRKSWKDMADKYDLELEIYVLPFDVDLSIKRNLEIGRFCDGHGIPTDEVIKKFEKNYVIPDETEGKIINVDNDWSKKQEKTK